MEKPSRYDWLANLVHILTMAVVILAGVAVLCLLVCQIAAHVPEAIGWIESLDWVR